MKSLLSPAAWARVIPFALFMALLALRANWPAAEGSWLDPRWLYGVSVLVVGGSLAYFWRRYGELGRGSGLSLWHALLSVGVGVGVFMLWVWLTEPWMLLGEPSASFRPVDDNGELLWGLVIVRWIGAAMLVPVMEDVLALLPDALGRQAGLRVDGPARGDVAGHAVVVARVHARAQPVAGGSGGGLDLCGAIPLHPHPVGPILAHAVTNGVLGAWVVVFGNWQFW